MSQTTTCLCILSFVALVGCSEEPATLLPDGGRIRAVDAGTGSPTGKVDGGIDAGRDSGDGDSENDEEVTDDDEPTDDGEDEGDRGPDRDARVDEPEFAVTSPDIAEGELLAAEHRCADAVSPALSWTPGPEGTQSYAVQLRNPEADTGLRSYWVLYDIPADVTEIPRDLPKEERIEDPFPARQAPDGSRIGTFGYYGPCTEASLELTVHAIDVPELPEIAEGTPLDERADEISALIAEHQIGEPARIEVKAAPADEEP